MSHRIGILVIHGMGSQRPGYADRLTASISSSLGRRSSRIVWQEIHWADALLDREAQLGRDMDAAVTPLGAPVLLRWRRTRAFVVHNFGDAIAYHRDASSGSAYRLIHRVVSASIAALKHNLDDQAAPVVVLAHSLGGHIMSNYIWDRQHVSARQDADEFEALPTLTSIITFGCSIPLFSLSFDVAEPILLPSPELPDGAVRRMARWINVLDPDDVLAWPLRPLYARHADRLSGAQRETLARIEDRLVDVGGLLTAWNPASHTRYDSDDDLARTIADHLDDVLDALDAAPITGPA
ncbi:MAG: hypothetical protein HKN17_11285 [Rhodothermales bacterium]|nr:hypothetical protein [Rhodothermales bacterium]